MFRRTLESVIPIIAFLASTGGSGAVAVVVFNWLREQFPLDQAHYGRGHALMVRLLHVPRNARLSSLVLAAAISITFTGILAAVQGQDVVDALDITLSAVLSALVSQVFHGLTLSSVLPPLDTDHVRDRP